MKGEFSTANHCYSIFRLDEVVEGSCMGLFLIGAWGPLAEDSAAQKDPANCLYSVCIMLGPPGCAQVSPCLSPGLLDFLVV